MYFDTIGEFFNMGGHGQYVWTCYSIALAILIFNIASPLLKKKQFLSEQTRRLKRERRASGNKG
ncbi:heme exporter protein CcmD [Motiliproteus sp. MSK22-1]|uniref:heme exporter protein CcmD n=1 Tax=Motiliproteus sp. MSK22-1 TaxID=1897630 RepID=UPI000978C94C|nr:heme exporter protein CcmD [Motiliproteus sp. MSK22-1]OMH30066.1 heme exporter protein CcmD [Motiliproteus sp. MSK22-1]